MFSFCCFFLLLICPVLTLKSPNVPYHYAIKVDWYNFAGQKVFSCSRFIGKSCYNRPFDLLSALRLFKVSANLPKQYQFS